jgi:hypothetical protein
MNAIDTERVQRVGSNSPSGSTVVEVPLLLDSRLLAALESAACRQGMTAGTLLRHLLRDFLDHAFQQPSAL